jgi:beta-alanine degradation protein BauB
MMLDNPRYARPQDLQDSYEGGKHNGCVGTVLLSETAKVRIWHLHVPVGQRFEFHRHVLNYFWTSLSDGRSRNYFENGSTSERDVYPGCTMHKEFALGEYMVHCIENIGTTALDFTTVEFLDSPNAALPIPDERRMQHPG